MVAPSSTTRSASQRTRTPRAFQLAEPLASSTDGSGFRTSATRPPPRAQRRRDADRDQPVESDRSEQQGACQSLTPEGRHVDDDERAVDRVEEKSAECRTE